MTIRPLTLTLPLCLTLLANPSNGLAAEKMAKDLEIPERREFPAETSINPCENFYEYSCNKVTQNFQLPADKPAWSFAFSDSAERLRRAKLRYLKELKQKPARELSSPREKLLASAFKGCLNLDATKREERTLVADTKKLLATVQNRQDFIAVMDKNMVTAEPSLLSFGTLANADNPDAYDVLLDNSPLLLLPEKDYYENADLVKDFIQVLTVFFSEAGFSEPHKRAERIMVMQKEIAKPWYSRSDERQLLNQKHYMEPEALKKKYSHLKMESLLKHVPTNSKIRIYSPETMDISNALFEKGNLEALKDLYAFLALQPFLKEAFPKFDKSHREFETKHFGSPAVEPPLEERCTRRMMEQYAKEVDAELMPKLFPNFPQQKVVDMVESVRASLVKSIEANTWLSVGAKKEAATKIRTAKLFLVGPQTEKAWYFNPTHDVTESAPIKNRKNRRIALVKRDLEELKYPVDHSIWGISPLTINAAYFPAENKFELPIGILQYPFFDTNGTAEANLGGIGAVIAHELGHGVDDQGSNYDSKGALRSWMDDADKKLFSDRTKSLVGQLDATGHVGSLVLGEVIGDLVGSTTAFEAAFPDGEGSLESKRNFFLAWGHNWCNVSKPAFEDYLKKNDPHPLGQARVNEILKHQPAFAETFQCKPENKMVLPANQRVRIW